VAVSLLDTSGLRAAAVAEAARRHPGTTFIVFGEVELGGANIAVVHWRKAEGGYLAGILAAGLEPGATTAGFLGGAAASLDVDAFETGFRAGVESADTSIAVATERVGFNDTPGARSAMTRLLDEGSRVVFAAAGPAARDAMALAGDRGAFVIGVDEDQSSVAPSAVIASVRVRADVVVGRLLAARARGELIAGIYEFGAGDGSIDLYLNPALAGRVPPPVVERLDAAAAAFRTGTLNLESPR
jgi:basic membrane protein A and related proteins